MFKLTVQFFETLVVWEVFKWVIYAVKGNLFELWPVWVVAEQRFQLCYRPKF